MEKDRKKAGKAKKFADKKAKHTESSSASTPSKSKEKRSKHEAPKEEPLPDYVEETPHGEKKSTQVSSCIFESIANKVISS